MFLPEKKQFFKLRGRLYMDHNWQAGLLMQFTVDNGIKFNISKSQSIDFYPNFGQDKWRLITFEGDNFQKAYMYKWNFTQWLNYAYSQSFTMLCMNLTGILINRCIRTCLFFPLQVTLRKLTKSSKNYLLGIVLVPLGDMHEIMRTAIYADVKGEFGTTCFQRFRFE